MTRKQKLRRWWWRHFVPRPNTIKEGGFERLVEWCAIREEDYVIWHCDYVDD